MDGRRIVLVVGDLTRNDEMLMMARRHMSHRDTCDIFVVDEMAQMDKEIFSGLQEKFVIRPALEPMGDLVNSICEPSIMAPRKGPERDWKAERRQLEQRGWKRPAKRRR